MGDELTNYVKILDSASIWVINNCYKNLTNLLIINTLVNVTKLQMCVFFRIFVCELKNRKAPICMAQRYEEFWTYTSNWPDKIACE